MSDDSEQLSVSRRSLEFKYTGQSYLLIGVSLISIVFILLGIAIESGPPSSSHVADVIIWSCGLMFLSFDVMVWRVQADIVIDDSAIARRTWGWTWKSVYWKDLRLLRVVVWKKPSGAQGTALKLYTSLSKPRLTPVFTILDVEGALAPLIVEINRIAIAHGIELEEWDGINIKKLSRIEV